MREAGGQVDARSFLELTFSTGESHSIVIDDDLRNRALSAECDYGTVLILFDDYGLLKSIELT